MICRVLPPNHRDGQLHPNSSGYDSTDEELLRARAATGLRAARSEDFLRHTGGRERRGKSEKDEKNMGTAGASGFAPVSAAGYTRNARESSTGRRYHHRDADGESWAQRERRLKSHSEANLLSYHVDEPGGGGGGGGGVDRRGRLSRSNGHLAVMAGSSRDLLRAGAFVNRAMEEEDEEDDDEDLEEEMALREQEEQEERMRRARSASR